MALENCLQLSTVCTTRVGAVQSHHTISLKERPNSPLFRSFPKQSFGSSTLTTTCTRKPLFLCKAKEALDQVQVATDSSWDSQVIASEYPVLVEFWAPWCGPCRMIAPVIDELAKEYSGKLECYKVNTDDCPNIATKYGIRSIPTVIFFKNGEKKESVIGAVPKSTLSATIDKYIEG